MKIECGICGGSGQISYFKGVSRFLLSWEECPECNGIDYTIVADDNKERVKGEKKNTEKAKKKTLGWINCTSFCRNRVILLC